MVTINKTKILSFVIVLAFLLFLIYKHESTKLFVQTAPVEARIGGKILKLDWATTQESQEKGLSGRDSLDENKGMLFVFQKPGKNYFWMKDMKFNIDMIWIDETEHVIYIEKNAKPESYPKTFGPDIDSKYVLEVNSGFSDKNNLNVGDYIQFAY